MIKTNKNEIIARLYGINQHSFEVLTASLTRDQTLSMMFSDGSIIPNQIRHGRSPEREVALAMDLTDVVSIPAAVFGTDLEKQVKANLEAKAAQLKQDAQKD